MTDTTRMQDAVIDHLTTDHGGRAYIDNGPTADYVRVTTPDYHTCLVHIDGHVHPAKARHDVDWNAS